MHSAHFFIISVVVVACGKLAAKHETITIDFCSFNLLLTMIFTHCNFRY